jgi:hypothetical protein
MKWGGASALAWHYVAGHILQLFGSYWLFFLIELSLLAFSTFFFFGRFYFAPEVMGLESIG